MSYLITWIIFVVTCLLGELVSTQNFKVVFGVAVLVTLVLLVHRIVVAAVEECP